MNIRCTWDSDFCLYLLTVEDTHAVLDEDEFRIFNDQLERLLICWTILTPQQIQRAIRQSGG